MQCFHYAAHMHKHPNRPYTPKIDNGAIEQVVQLHTRNTIAYTITERYRLMITCYKISQDKTGGLCMGPFLQDYNTGLYYLNVFLASVAMDVEYRIALFTGENLPKSTLVYCTNILLDFIFGNTVVAPSTSTNANTNFILATNTCYTVIKIIILSDSVAKIYCPCRKLITQMCYFPVPKCIIFLAVAGPPHIPLCKKWNLQ